MPIMLLPILRILVSQFLIMDNKQILSVILLSSLCKIEGPCYDGLPINNHHLIVSYGVLRIYSYRDSLL